MSSSYALLDFGNGERLEQWGSYRLIRPDPTATGNPAKPDAWQEVDALYEGKSERGKGTEKGKGEWIRYSQIPERWTVAFDDVQMTVKLAPYKHTGVFPEQLDNWRWMRGRGKGRGLKVLNLFAYTGGATMALAKNGHKVTHVDASKPAITWAKENSLLNQIPEDRIRWMLEDAPLFVQRELKRGNQYDAIIVDAPAYGHSPSGKTWRVERDLAPLLEQCAILLSDQPAFLLVNGYAKGDTAESYHRLLNGILHAKLPGKKFSLDASEVFLVAEDGRRLSTGVTVKCDCR